MSSKTNRITITKPTWPPGWKESISSWDKMHSVVKAEFGKDYVINVLPTTHGLAGVKTGKNYLLNNVNQNDLFIAYHLDSAYPKSIGYKGAYYESLWYFDSDGYGGFSNICNKNLLENVNAKIDYDGFYNKSVIPLISKTKYENDNKKPLESNIPQDNFLFVALQVENDTVMSLKQIETLKMIERVIEVSDSMGIPTVIKCHPKAPNRHKITLHVKRLCQDCQNKNRSVYISEGNVKELLNRCKAVFVINSGVGFEGMLRLKPVFTFGKSDYNQGAYNNYSTSQIIDTLQNPIDINVTKQFLYHWWQEIVDFNDDSYYDKLKNRILEKLK